MALPILDGNQTSTTLATTVSGGAHYPNHIIANGTVTANVTAIDNINNVPTSLKATDDGFLIVSVESLIGGGNVPISGTVTANVPLVDVGLFSGVTQGIPVYLAGGKDGVVIDEINYINNILGTVTISGTVTAGGLWLDNGDNVKANIVGFDGADVPDWLRGNPTVVPISGTVTIGSALPTGTNRIGEVTIGGGTVTIGAGTAQIGSVTASISGTVPISISSVTVGNSVTIGSLPSISGTVTANNPNGTLTTRFGSVTTANTAQITTAVTNTSRKYLLCQNNQTGTSAGTVTIGIGFTPTTTQGIQLISGASYTADSFIPTGAVYWLGAVTGATFTILEG